MLHLGMVSDWPNLPFFFYYVKSLYDCRKNWRLNISETKRLYLCTIFKCIKLVSSNNVCMGGYIFILLFGENALWFEVSITKCWTDSLAYIYSTWDSQVVPVQTVWLGLGQLSLWDLSAFSLVVAVTTKIVCLAKQAFCLPPTPKPKASSCRQLIRLSGRLIPSANALPEIGVHQAKIKKKSYIGNHFVYKKVQQNTVLDTFLKALFPSDYRA